MVSQLPAPLALARLKAAETVQARHDRCCCDSQQGRGAVEPGLGGEAAEKHEGGRTGDNADLHNAQRVQPPRDGALKQSGDEADEAEKLPGL